MGNSQGVVARRNRDPELGNAGCRYGSNKTFTRYAKDILRKALPPIVMGSAGLALKLFSNNYSSSSEERKVQEKRHDNKLCQAKQFRDKCIGREVAEHLRTKTFKELGAMPIDHCTDHRSKREAGSHGESANLATVAENDSFVGAVISGVVAVGALAAAGANYNLPRIHRP